MPCSVTFDFHYIIILCLFIFISGVLKDLFQGLLKTIYIYVKTEINDDAFIEFHQRGQGEKRTAAI